jgi:cell division protein FtsL
MSQVAQTAGTRAIPRFDGSKESFVGIKYSTFIIFSIVLMAVALVYVWSHIRMTQLEYSIAAEINTKEQVLEEQKKLRLEYAMLKSPQRIESIVRSRLQMSYPDNDQVIVIKKSGD